MVIRESPMGTGQRDCGLGKGLLLLYNYLWNYHGFIPPRSLMYETIVWYFFNESKINVSFDAVIVKKSNLGM